MKLLLMVIAALIFVVLFQVGKILIHIKRLNYTVEGYRQPHPNAQMRVLFLGDSTAQGVGGHTPKESVAGWFGQDFPQAHIDNISQMGLRLSQLKERLGVVRHLSYDLIIIQIGANDIMRMTPLKKVREDLSSILNALKGASKNIIILHSGKVGDAPIFSWPFNWILNQRSLAVRKIYKEEVQKYGAIYVDLVALEESEGFTYDQSTHYAADGLHLSGLGYSVWYKQVRKAMKSIDF